MKPNYNSISARLYRAFYEIDEMPTNLCPYFWKQVIMYILWIPYLTFSLPFIIIESLSNKRLSINNLSSDNKFESCLIGTMIYALLSLSILLLVCEYHLIKYWFNAYSYDSRLATGAGLINIVVVVALNIIAIVKYFRNKKENNRSKETSSNILIEFIKAKYNNYCPTLEWQGKIN